MRLALLLALTAGCQFPAQYCEGDWKVTPPESAPAKREQVVAQVLPIESKAVDILFVIDDSGSMLDQQKQLGIWSAEMFDVLSGTGELPDLHIGVTTSSVAIPDLEQCRNMSGGDLRAGADVDGRFLIDVASETGRERNYQGTLTEAFAKIARVGDGGCGFEQPFKAAKLALATEGFLREDALLLVVFVTDEDDCSSNAGDYVFSDAYADACSDLGALTSYRCFEHGVRCADGKGSREFGERSACRPDETSPYIQSVAGFAQYLKKLKQFPAQTLVAGIYGKPNGVFAIPDEKVQRLLGYETPRLGDVCGGHGEEGTGATPGVRVNALLAEFGGRASQSSICEPELSWAMRDVGLVTRGAAKRSRCLRGSAIDAARCRVEAVRIESTSRSTSRSIPFSIETDESCESKLAVHPHAVTTGDETLMVTCDTTVE